MLLGFSLAYLSIKYIVAENEASIDVPARILLCISLLFVPCIDLCRVVLERIAHGEHPFMPDKRHIHHRLMSAGIYGNFTLAGVLSLSLLFMAMNAILYCLGCSLSVIVSADIVLYIILMTLLSRKVRSFERTQLMRETVRERFAENAVKAKKICILTPRFPVPENGGDVLRINNIARQLKRDGYELVLVSFEDDGMPQIFEAERIYDKVYTVHRNRFNSLWQSLRHLLMGKAMQCGYYYSARYKRLLSSVIEKEQPDLYIAHLLRMMPYLDDMQLHDRSIIEMTDALSKTYSLSSKSKGNGLLRHIYAIERHLIRRAEQYSMMYFPVNVLVSEADAEYLRTISAHNASLTVHTNGVDVGALLQSPLDLQIVSAACVFIAIAPNMTGSFVDD
jgi:hypothetical protein